MVWRRYAPGKVDPLLLLDEDKNRPTSTRDFLVAWFVILESIRFSNRLFHR
jgi:hypothetical protein